MSTRMINDYPMWLSLADRQRSDARRRRIRAHRLLFTVFELLFWLAVVAIAHRFSIP